jgi:opacity protein-like surface antigen
MSIHPLASFVTVSCLIVYATSTARADEDLADVPPKLTVGATLGMSMATQGTEAPFGTDIEAGSKPGLALGVAASIVLYRASTDDPGFFIAAQPEVLYVAKGTNLDVDGDTLGAYHLSYIEIPLLARVGFQATRSLAPYLLLGPELGILLSAELENSRGEFSDSSDGLKKTDVGLVIGGGVALDIAALAGALNIDARYDLGLTDINDTGMGGFVKNRAFFVTLGYQYGAW